LRYTSAAARRAFVGINILIGERGTRKRKRHALALFQRDILMGKGKIFRSRAATSSSGGIPALLGALALSAEKL
jgi:hypothetical protein